MAGYKVLQGSMLDILPTLDENSFDSCVTDPPYELGFMGKSWDSSGVAFQPDTWKQVFRVLKPGAYLLAFGGSRTFHRIAVAIEDAGFEIRDTMMWIYGSGFPKSHNIGLAVDEINGVESKVVGNGKSGSADTHTRCMNSLTKDNKEVFGGDYEIKEAQNEWKGWGTALKPAFEPIIVARKPIAEKSVAENCLKWGVGGINIDECRVGYQSEKDYEATKVGFKEGSIDKDYTNVGRGFRTSPLKTNNGFSLTGAEGRFPANIITDGSDEVAQGFPNTKSTGGSGEASTTKCFSNVNCGSQRNTGANLGGLGDEGSAMRYFYTAKASKKDRDEGLDMFDILEISDGCKRANAETSNKFGSGQRFGKNIHPTVKPIELMQYLVRLVSPKGGNILEPFAGSGSTGKAAMFENRERDANYDITMIELTAEYIPIIKARCEYAINKYEYDEKKERERTGQLSLFDSYE